MSEFVFNCPFCDQPIAADDSLCGEPDVCPNCENNISIPIPGLEKGVQFGDFELLDLLGAGATGEVWKARQLSMNRIVALKVLLPNLTTNKNFIERFKQEAHHSAKLSHPMIVTAYYYGQDKGIHYLATTYVEGKTIAEELKGGEVYTEAKALGIIRGISTALAYAWNEFKIIHRDIKPENIMIDSKGNPMLLDLAIAKSTDEEMGLTMTGMIIGTPYYMSPEQAKGHKDIDFKADIYSLGCTLFHMLTGQVPYSGDTMMETMLKHLNEDFPSPRKINPSISIKTEKLIKKMIMKERNNRYQYWEDLIEDIDMVLKNKNLIHAKAPFKASLNFIIFISIIIIASIIVGIFYINKMKDSKTSLTNTPIIQADKESLKERKLTIGISKKKSGVKTSQTAKKYENKNSTQTIKIMEDDNRNNNPIIARDNIQIDNAPKYYKVITEKPAVKNHSITYISEERLPIKTTQPAKKYESENTTQTLKIVEDENNDTIIAPADIQIENNPKYFKTVAENLDVKKHPIRAIENYWNKIIGKRYKWAGKITYYRNIGINKYEVRVAIPGAKLFNDYNVVLHLKASKEIKKLGRNRTVLFDGKVFDKQLLKGTGAVIIHLKNIKKLSIY